MTSLPAMSDEQAFVWLRARAPSAGEIVVTFDPLTHERIVTLHGATDEDAGRLRSSLGLLSPAIGPSRVEVRS